MILEEDPQVVGYVTHLTLGSEEGVGELTAGLPIAKCVAHRVVQRVVEAGLNLGRVGKTSQLVPRSVKYFSHLYKWRNFSKVPPKLVLHVFHGVNAQPIEGVIVNVPSGPI